MSAAGHRRVQPAFAVLRAGTVRRIGIEAEEKLLPSMLEQNPEPLAAAAWQMAVAFRALGDLIESGSDKAVAAGEDVATRLMSALEDVHRHLGRAVPAGRLAERSFERQVDRIDTGEAAVGAVTVEVVLAEGVRAATVHLAQERPDAPVQIRGDVKAGGQLDGAAHLDVQAGLEMVARALAPYIEESATRPL
ncbi:hypothetical protein ACIGZJ_36615 [Kitasatospora sp. NPDC052868]|uniref:hypothetical protein n=1 Tax=Kitasatospora sp. NPDC052868 TaxID=3364060 RepID=UPI0037C84753